MDIMSIIGLVAAVVLMIFGMAGDVEFFQGDFRKLMNFVDIPSVAITIGGTFAALMLMFPVKVFASLPKLLLKVFLPQKFNPQTYILEIVDIAQDVRKNGLLYIDDKISTYKDEFMRKGLQLAVDSTDPEMLRDIMETELGFMMDRHKLGTLFFEKGAGLAPGFGMIGTLVGLINMLKNMDPTNLMNDMGVALITTFYGSLLANVVFLPMGNKLQKRSDEEILCKQIIIEGVIAIVNGESPPQIREKLVSYIPPAMRNLDRVKRDAASSSNAGGGN
jgi:chemotaxis protein MotA